MADPTERELVVCLHYAEGGEEGEGRCDGREIMELAVEWGGSLIVERIVAQVSSRINAEATDFERMKRSEFPFALNLHCI